MQAVITGDLISSSQYPKGFLEKVSSELKKEFKELENKYGGNFSFWRGDSFQGSIGQAEDALNVTLGLKALVNKIAATPSSRKVKSQAPTADVRIAVALGEVMSIAAEPAESNEEIFIRSGKTLDSMQSAKRTIVLRSGNPSIDRELDVELTLLEFLTDRWSVASAEVVYFKLKGLSDQEIAAKLDVSLPAVYKRKKIAGWNACELVINRYAELLGQLQGYEVRYE